LYPTDPIALPLSQFKLTQPKIKFHMKTFSTTIASLMCCLLSFMALADDPNLPPPDNVILIQKGGSNKRPNAPGRSFIECHYGNGYIDFTFLPNSNFMTVELVNDEISVWTELITIENPLIELPSNLSGEYNIVCTTDKDQVFVGTIYL
ncbi:MAG: hypothetical protein K2L90_00545, partial [Muribaculaceae bacterium]|nr:hypothetical protein [Muribaculaceae bacterium]